MIQPPQIYTIRNGTLSLRDSTVNPIVQLQPQKIIKYTHIARATPDQYHTQMIKEYRKENEELRRMNRQLEKAYYQLLGYCQENKYINFEQSTPIDLLYKDDREMSQSITKHSSINVSSFELDQNESSRKKEGRLSESILQQQEVEDFLNNPQISKYKQRTRNSKTESDENIQQLLIEAFKEVQELKEMLEIVKHNCTVQIQELKNEYERKLEQVQSALQREKKQSRLLNALINRMRDQLEAKEGFFREIQEMRNGAEKQMFERLMKQHKIAI